MSFYIIDILMEALSIHNCAVLQWVPLGLGCGEPIKSARSD